MARFLVADKAKLLVPSVARLSSSVEHVPSEQLPDHPSEQGAVAPEGHKIRFLDGLMSKVIGTPAAWISEIKAAAIEERYPLKQGSPRIHYPPDKMWIQFKSRGPPAETCKEHRLPLADVPEGYMACVKIGQGLDASKVPKSQVATFGEPTPESDAQAWVDYKQEVWKWKNHSRIVGRDKGLRHDDVMFLDVDNEIATEALKRCDPDERDMRAWRMARAQQLGHLRISADEADCVTHATDVHYLKPWINQVDKEQREADHWDNY